MRLLSSSSKRPSTAVASSPLRVPESFLEIYNSLPHLENVDPSTLHEYSRDRLHDEDFFDNIMNRCNSFPLYEAFEPVICKMFNAERVILWENRPDLRDFYSRRLEKQVSISNPIIDIIISKKKNCAIYDNLKEPQLAQQFVTNSDSPQLFFSLYLNNGSIIAIIQITRSLTSIPALFDNIDEQKAIFVARKFYIYGSYSFAKPQMISFASELSHYGNLKTTADSITNSIRSKFGCSNVDFWFYNEQMNLFTRYEKNSGFVNIYRSTSGIIGAALRNGISINEAFCRQNQNYQQAIDGDPDNPILISTCKFNDKTWACALRGPRTGYSLSYSGEDCKYLSTLMPFIARSLAYSAQLSQPPPTPNGKIEEKIENTLDTAALITSSIDIKQLTENIETRFKLIVGCEFVKLLIITKNQREFLNGEKNFPVNVGISGLTYSSQKASIYDNPEDEKGFNPELDSSKEITKIKSFLSYPILINYMFSNTDNSPNKAKTSSNFCTAVINFYNKNDGSQFKFSDIEKINSISQFCAHAIQNAISYQSVIGVTNHLRLFMRASKQVLQLSSAKNALKEILQSAKEMFSASRVTLFMKNPKGSEKPLYEFLNVEDTEENHGHQRSQNTKNAEEAIKRKETVKINFGPYFICTTPLFDSHMNILGAMEIGVKETKGRVEEGALIESFAMIAAISLERLKLEKLAEIGHVHNSFKKLLSENERESFQTPNVLKGNRNLFTLDFDVNDDKCDQTEMLKIVFSAFDKYDMKNIFRITNQKLFLFLIDISKTYRRSGFHSWKHAIDVLHFIIYMLSVTSFHQHMEKYELLSLIVAAICHNASHDDFDKMKTSKNRSKVPFEIFYRSQSVEEMRSIEVTIQTMSKDECNLLSSLDYDDQKQIWKLIIKLILSTSIRNHFKFMKSIEEIVSSEKIDLKNKKNRHSIMMLMMKCAYFASLTRNFESAQRSIEAIGSEFFMQGRVDKCSGLKYNDDKKLNIERSLPGVLNSVVLPPFESFMSVFESMKDSVDSLKSNIEKFTVIVKEKYKAEEEKERKIEEERKRKEEEERRRKEEEERKRKEEEERKRKEEERKRKEEEERKRKEEEERKRKEEEERIKREEEERKKKEEERKKKEEERIRKEKEEEERKRKEEEERIKKEEIEKAKKHEEEEEKSMLSDDNEERIAVEDEPASDEGDNNTDEDD